MEPELDAVRRLILSRANETKETLKSLSLKLPKSHSYLQQFIYRGIPRELPEKVRKRLAQLIDVDETELGATVGEGHPEMPVQTALEPRQNARVGGYVRMGATVPVYGQASGGRDGQFVLNGNKVADILAPASLANVRDAYAVYVIGDSMEPRYHPGEAVFVNPRLPVRKGDYVVAQIAGDEGAAPEAYVKRFLSKDGRHLKLEQVHPRKLLQFPAARVVSVHRIIMGGDG